MGFILTQWEGILWGHDSSGTTLVLSTQAGTWVLNLGPPSWWKKVLELYPSCPPNTLQRWKKESKKEYSSQLSQLPVSRLCRSSTCSLKSLQPRWLAVRSALSVKELLRSNKTDLKSACFLLSPSTSNSKQSNDRVLLPEKHFVGCLNSKQLVWLRLSLIIDVGSLSGSVG